MTALVLQVHPVDASFGAAVGAAAMAGLETAGERPALIRLCQGDALERSSFDDVGHLVVVHPTWWGSLPAALLAALQPLIGDEIDSPQRRPGLLRDVSRLTIIATHGGSKFINAVQGEPGRKFWRTHVLSVCRPGASFAWIALHKIDQISHEKRTAFLARVERDVSAT